MLFPYEEHGLLGNLLGIGLLYISILLVYFVFRPLLFKLKERNSEPIEAGTDVPHEEYWRED